MISIRSTRTYLLLMLAPLAIATETAGQGPRTVKANLIGENADLPLRLAAANRLVDPLGTPELVAKNIGFLSDPMTLYPSLTAVMAEQNTPDRWEQVLGEYERFLQDASDILVPLPRSVAPLAAGVPSVQIRRLVHERLATLPPSLLVKYRQRVDEQAAKLLQAGRLNHDPAPLRKIVDEMFCSRSGEHALDLLGDLAFERGEFGEAEYWWSRLTGPLDSSRNGGDIENAPWPRFPLPTINPALPRAKQILARIFLGQTAEAARDLKAFRSGHGQARGHLAGKTGILADLLADVLDQARQRRLFRPEPTWHTFAGSPTRQHVLTEALPPRLWADGPTWKRPLPGKKEPARKLGSHPQPAFHPIIVDDQVILADAGAVYGFNLLTGEPMWTYDLKAIGMPVNPVESLPADMTPYFTLSAGGGKVFVRLGKVSVRHSGEKDKDPKEDPSPNHLVCLDVSTPQARELWRLSVGGNVMFEGSPLVVEERVYFASTRVMGQRTLTSLVCFDTVKAKQRWSTDICESLESEASEPARGRHQLLTLTNGQIVFCSHSGAIVAVDPWSGRRQWGLRYPSRPRVLADGTLAPRSLAPCVFHDNRLYVAPQDSDSLFCLDPGNGMILWERPGIDAVHLLGAVGPRLFFSTLRGFRAVNSLTGGDDVGWAQPAVGKLPSLGRGLLMGDWILWPTQDPQLPLRALHQTDGSQEGAGGVFYEPTQLHRLIAGNMAYASGCLVVAGSDELAVYVRPSRLLKKLSQVKPASPAAEYRLALALADAGEDQQAQQLLVDLGRHGPMWGRLARQSLVDLYKANPIDILMSPQRKRGKTGLDIDQLVKLLHDPRLEQEFVLDDKHLPRSLADVVRGQIRASWSGAFEDLAEKELARAGTQTADLIDVSRRFSGTKAAVKALVELARIQETHHPADAAWAFRLLLDQPLEPRQLEQTRANLQRVLVKIEPAHTTRAPEALLPVLRRWEAPGRNMLDLSAPGDFPGAGHPLLALRVRDLLTVDGKAITCRTLIDGKENWSQPAPFAVEWARAHAEVVVAAGPDGAAGFLRDTGRLLWHFPSPAIAGLRVQLQADAPVFVRQGTGLADFRLGGDRLIFCSDQRRLICVDVFTGKPIWTKWAPAAAIRPLLDGGKFLPDFAVTDKRVLIHSNDGKRWLLETNTGRTVMEAVCLSYPTPLLVEKGRKACLPLAEGVIITLDMETGREAWRFNHPWRTSLWGEPALILEQEKQLLAVFTLNYGHEIWRLDLGSGKALWQEPILLPGRATEWCTGKPSKGEERFYYILDNRLFCRGMNNGKILWQRALPAGASRWQVRAYGDALLLCPNDAVELPLVAMTGLNLNPLVNAARPSAPAADPAIWVLDAADGSPLQRLPTRGARVQMLLSPAGIVTAEQGQLRGYMN